MDNNEFYQSLPVDLSGSRSKNRFRLELLWGLGKLIDLRYVYLMAYIKSWDSLGRFETV